MGHEFSFGQVTAPKMVIWKKEEMGSGWKYVKAVSNGRLDLLIVLKLQVLLLETSISVLFYMSYLLVCENL